MKPYDHKKIEKKWGKVWEDKKTYQTLDAQKAKVKKMKPYYVLDMFPYPSGSGLHVGHPRGYIGSDIFARLKRMQGFNVLHPMGYDAFGLPAEQFAVQNNIHPAAAVAKNIKTYRSQLEKIGFSFDWSRQVNTTDPEYYRWTQWIFLQIYNSYYDTAKQKARPIAELIKKFEKSGSENFTAKQWKSFSELEQQKILMDYRLAYEGFAEVNWCPQLGTVLANDEVIDGPKGLVSERGEFPVEKKQMRQWFMRITAYADRLLEGLNSIDWPENIKEIQRNWIGKSEGSEIDFEIKGFSEKISVFTTRADTLFGVTYVVLAPEHPLLFELKHSIKNWNHVAQYIEQVKNKSDADRLDAKKEKTGVALHGIIAINPANGEQIPVWVADYVLASYGTGAVMGVPAHDERDFEFAKKYELPIKHVIARPSVEKFEQQILRRDAAVSIVENSKGEILVLQVEGQEKYMFPQGGIDEGENPQDTAIRETAEESGYVDTIFQYELGGHENYFQLKEGLRYRLTHTYVLKLLSDKNIGLNLDPGEAQFKNHWIDPKKALDVVNFRNHKLFLELYLNPKSQCFLEQGLLIQSGKFNNLSSEQAKKKITEFVGGRLVTKYKMRDAIFARQRYWGEPIPLMHTKEGIIVEVADKKLPLKLPNVTSYQPSGTGESPLATVSSWVNAGYETNTMPGWAGSSWYFLRYMDPSNKKVFAEKKELDYWFNKKSGGVDMYVGGAEHATGHLLYSRFWNKCLYDLGYIAIDEPFKSLRNQGLIGGADGRKMSKSLGNVVNPDDIIETVGADTLRVYESFMGPFESHLPWSTEGIAGSRRFIERVWKFTHKIQKGKTSKILEKQLHKTIKKVTDDILGFSFNTAISAMMIFINELDKSQGISQEDFKKFLQILAPFAPYVAEELWSELGEKKSIHLSSWPSYHKKLVIDDTVTIGIQVNGKVRSEITISLDVLEEDVKNMTLQIPDIIKWIDGKPIKKFIYIPGKIISIVC